MILEWHVMEENEMILAHVFLGGDMEYFGFMY